MEIKAIHEISQSITKLFAFVRVISWIVGFTKRTLKLGHTIQQHSNGRNMNLL